MMGLADSASVQRDLRVVSCLWIGYTLSSKKWVAADLKTVKRAGGERRKSLVTSMQTDAVNSLSQ
jgi:hypothetical protein